jgi:hypothetical protein
MWPFKKTDWRETGEARWNTVKKTSTHILQRRQTEFVDFVSGELKWEDVDFGFGWGYYERIVPILPVVDV